MISRAEKRRALKLQRKEEKRNLKKVNPLDAMPSEIDLPPFDVPPELQRLFLPQISVCFGEEDENGDPIEYDMMSLSNKEFYSKLENMGKGAK